MDERNYRLWMYNVQRKSFHTSRTYAARCLRVENELKIDLDEQYDKDFGVSTINMLKYTKKEYYAKLQPSCGIVLNPDSNMYSCMNSLRASVNNYFEYRSWKETMAKNEG